MKKKKGGGGREGKGAALGLPNPEEGILGKVYSHNGKASVFTGPTIGQGEEGRKKKKKKEKERKKGQGN